MRKDSGVLMDRVPFVEMEPDRNPYFFIPLCERLCSF